MGRMGARGLAPTVTEKVVPSSWWGITAPTDCEGTPDSVCVCVCVCAHVRVVKLLIREKGIVERFQLPDRFPVIESSLHAAAGARLLEGLCGSLKETISQKMFIRLEMLTIRIRGRGRGKQSCGRLGWGCGCLAGWGREGCSPTPAVSCPAAFAARGPFSTQAQAGRCYLVNRQGPWNGSLRSGQTHLWGPPAGIAGDAAARTANSRGQVHGHQEPHSEPCGGASVGQWA